MNSKKINRDKLFIIGNGFDLAHNLPTRFDPHFKNIAKTYENYNFWDLYQCCEDDIWSDFENLLGHPDFNSLEEIFDGYTPDYSSERESDRDSIITQVQINGNLNDALYEFAEEAEKSLQCTKIDSRITKIIDINAYYISFNYTHTLEKIYNIPLEHILHIHGEVGKNNLKLGYTKGNFIPEKYSFDFRKKGRGPYIDMKIDEYIDNHIDDFYVRTAYTELLDKCKNFYKEVDIESLENFLDNKVNLEEIIVYGHSCAIDYDYFNYLNTRYSEVCWKFYVKGYEQEYNVYSLIEQYTIKNAIVIKL